MTPQIYFFSEAGYSPMKDATLKLLSGGSHGWQADGQKWVFGVCHVKEGVHPLELAAHMTSLGIAVLPSLNDTTTPIDPKVYAALSQWIAPAARTREIATSMGKFHPLLRPSDY